MDKKTSLTPIEQKQVIFYDDEITAVLVDTAAGRTIYVPVRPICDYLGVDWSSQLKRIDRDPVLGNAGMSVVITTTDIPDPSSRRPNTSEMYCLPLKYIPGWLFGINASRIRSDLRDKIIRYQSECFDVLSEAFQEGRLTADPSFSELLKQEDSAAVQAYKSALAVVQLAKTQVLMEARLNAHEQRLETLEAQLGDTNRAVTPSQATDISQAVKTIAMVLSKRTGRNEYGGVYSEMYRKFGIPSYKQLPAAQFDACMKWLRGWWQELTDDSVPF